MGKYPHYFLVCWLFFAFACNPNPQESQDAPKEVYEKSQDSTIAPGTAPEESKQALKDDPQTAERPESEPSLPKGLEQARTLYSELNSEKATLEKEVPLDNGKVFLYRLGKNEKWLYTETHAGQKTFEEYYLEGGQLRFAVLNRVSLENLQKNEAERFYFGAGELSAYQGQDAEWTTQSDVLQQKSKTISVAFERTEKTLK